MRRFLQVVGVIAFLGFFARWILPYLLILPLMNISDAWSMAKTGLFTPPTMPLHMLFPFAVAVWYIHRNATLRSVFAWVPVLRPMLTMAFIMLVGTVLAANGVYLVLQAGGRRGLAGAIFAISLLATRLGMSWWYHRHPLVPVSSG